MKHALGSNALEVFRPDAGLVNVTAMAGLFLVLSAAAFAVTTLFSRAVNVPCFVEGVSNRNCPPLWLWPFCVSLILLNASFIISVLMAP